MIRIIGCVTLDIHPLALSAASVRVVLRTSTDVCSSPGTSSIADFLILQKGGEAASCCWREYLATLLQSDPLCVKTPWVTVLATVQTVAANTFGEGVGRQRDSGRPRGVCGMNEFTPPGIGDLQGLRIGVDAFLCLHPSAFHLLPQLAGISTAFPRLPGAGVCLAVHGLGVIINSAG